jgi:hypothetical protein
VVWDRPAVVEVLVARWVSYSGLQDLEQRHMKKKESQTPGHNAVSHLPLSLPALPRHLLPPFVTCKDGPLKHKTSTKNRYNT